MCLPSYAITKNERHKKELSYRTSKKIELYISYRRIKERCPSSTTLNKSGEATRKSTKIGITRHETSYLSSNSPSVVSLVPGVQTVCDVLGMTTPYSKILLSVEDKVKGYSELLQTTHLSSPITPGSSLTPSPHSTRDGESPCGPRGLGP